LTASASGLNSPSGPGAELLAYVGRHAAPPRRAPMAVDAGLIRNWCLALGDSLPIYSDPEFAAQTRWGGIIAPPTMLQAWTLHDRREIQPPPGPDHAEAELMALIADEGYIGVVATNCEQTYLRALRPGDRLTSQATITDIAGPKRTGLGEGFFVTTETEYRDEQGELVGTMLFRALRYRAAERDAGAPPLPTAWELTANPTEVVGRSMGPVTTETRRVADVSVGDELPQLEIPLTPTLIISGALASNDFNVLHHDRDRAQAAGAPDIFMNILTTNGLVGRYVTEWAGPEASLERVAIRLGAPNYPYDTFRLSGQVTGCEERDGKQIVQLAIRGTNSVGDHATGSAEVELP
jgi:acyl dehydratase